MEEINQSIKPSSDTILNSHTKSNSTIGWPKLVNPGWIDSNTDLYSAKIN